MNFYFCLETLPFFDDKLFNTFSPRKFAGGYFGVIRARAVNYEVILRQPGACNYEDYEGGLVITRITNITRIRIFLKIEKLKCTICTTVFNFSVFLGLKFSVVSHDF